MSLKFFPFLSVAQASAENNALFPELSNIFNWAIGIGATLALISIIYSGIIYTISAGNESQKKQAIGRIKDAILGMIFLIGAFVLLQTIDPNILRPGAMIPELPELRGQRPPAAMPIFQTQDIQVPSFEDNMNLLTDIQEEAAAEEVRLMMVTRPNATITRVEVTESRVGVRMRTMLKIHVLNPDRTTEVINHVVGFGF